ncbi:hypothetical protein BDK92_7078 [Micromonospora pisi]|uniref:Uncharacterized protein n=1 Tax=Micromonospora pisi TaxID=589240 RepID=A0A495JUF7_9ACTN|nr:hypothetical protein [Micromonospora pisi]RKR92636.1 hypothetical protein BDK92_7078 [Micromonospora pisi]
MTDSKPPIWLLDIDGVINAISRKPVTPVWPKHQWFTGRARSGGQDWPILAATPVLDFLRDAHDRGRAEIWWHTTWQDEAVNLSRLLDLPHFPVRPAPDFTECPQGLAGLAALSTRRGWWKYPAAERVVGIEGRALVWTDDDANWELRAHDDGAALAKHAPTLIVSPKTGVGLTRKHLDLIDRFLTDQAG